MRTTWAGRVFIVFGGLVVGASLAWPGTLHARLASDGDLGPADLRAHDAGAKVVGATLATRLLPEVHQVDDAAAQVDPPTGLAQYSDVARNAGGTLGDYLKTTENMAPALRVTSGDFAQQVAALDAAHAAMARAALRRGDASSVEAQGRRAIQGANEAINAQGKTEEYTDNLLKTGAFERQWGRRPDQQFADSASADAGSGDALPTSVVADDSASTGAVIRDQSGAIRRTVTA